MDKVPHELRRHQAELGRLDPLDSNAQAIEYVSKRWERHFPGDVSLKMVTEKYPGVITRGDLAQLARIAKRRRDDDSARALFLGAMLWGYGTVGYGPYRTARMLGAPNARKVLVATLHYVLAGQIRKAYEEFRLPWCGPAFFTKYFYFAGLESDLRPRPLILDTVVANVLERWLRVGVNGIARVVREKGRITEIARDPDGYERYIQLLNGWAEELKCAPDGLELFLFNRRG